MATGAIVGGILGAALGGGSPLGYALGSGVGRAIDGGILWNKANNKKISETDPRTRLLYDEIVRKRKGLESGQLYQPQQDAIRQAGAQTMQTAAGVTGGDIGATVSALRGINRSTGRNLNELYGQMMGQSTNLLGQQTAVDQMLYNWNYQRQAYEKQQAMAHAAETLKDSMANVNAVIASRGDELGADFKRLLKRLFGGNNNTQDAGTNAGTNGLMAGESGAAGVEATQPQIAAPQIGSVEGLSQFGQPYNGVSYGIPAQTGFTSPIGVTIGANLTDNQRRLMRLIGTRSSEGLVYGNNTGAMNPSMYDGTLGYSALQSAPLAPIFF